MRQAAKRAMPNGWGAPLGAPKNPPKTPTVWGHYNMARNNPPKTPKDTDDAGFLLGNWELCEWLSKAAIESVTESRFP